MSNKGVFHFATKASSAFSTSRFLTCFNQLFQFPADGGYFAKTGEIISALKIKQGRGAANLSCRPLRVT